MSWFGRAVLYVRHRTPIFTGVGLSVGVVVSLLPQTLLLQRYRKILAHTQNDEEKPIDSHTQSLIERVLQRFALKAEEEVDLQFFTCFASDPLHAGSLKIRFGAIIGLPGTFAYKDVADINKEELLLDQMAVDWNSANGETLLKSLVLSDKAKAFAIAREINFATFHQIHVETFMRSVFGVLAYSCGHILNKYFALDRRLKFWARFSLYSLIASAWFVLYVAVKDSYYCWQDNSADRKAAALSKAYAEGGVEYYNKVLSRNKALRALMVTTGPKRYTAYGNVVSTWRRDHVELTARRDNLQKYLIGYENV